MGIEELKAQKEALDRQERTTGNPGAVPRMPKERLLDASDVEAKHPDKHLRFVNIKDPQKAESRQQEGYSRLTTEEGGRQVGNELALFGIPKEKYQERVAAQEKRNSDLLEAHRGEMQRAAIETARYLRDQHGVRVSEKRLLVDEDS